MQTYHSKRQTLSNAVASYYGSSEFFMLKPTSYRMPLDTHGICSASGRRKPRIVKRARVVSDREFEHVLGVAISDSAHPLIDELALLFSFLAGLRASEIASLRIDDVSDAAGRIGNTIHIRGRNSKSGRDREIAMHPRIHDALLRFRRAYPASLYPVHSRRDVKRPTTANALTVWFKRLYVRAGLPGCTSHSGRRTCITNLAKRANRFNNSLRDVQLIAGHARLETTSSYIDASEHVAPLIASLGT